MRDLLITGAQLADGTSADLGVSNGHFVAPSDVTDAERIDAFITDELVGRALIKKIFPGKEGEFETVDKPDSAAALYVIVRKGNAAGETMVASLNAGLLKLKEAGELEQIVAKYVR